MAYDCVIIGTGAAGVSAALNLKIHNKSFLLIGSPDLSEKTNKAEKISNYPGLIDISGKDFVSALKDQLRAMEIEITPGVVNSVMPMGETYGVLMGSEFFETRTVILSTGVAMTALIPGENDFLGRGVSYCATCDGGLYRGRTIAVLCTDKRFEHEISYLSEIADRVYFFPYYKDYGSFGENVIPDSRRIIGISGDSSVNAVKLNDKSELSVDGLFCLRSSVALNSLFGDLKAENGAIVVDRRMATNLPGVFAAGDCTGRPYQYTKAVGEGNVAAHSVIQYLDA